ncbi:hypothetical protein [Clostridium culturomicium]|uniref:hypothetical protein n=1 Tax=Clostridium culturomicium TaxID=1499683 RepID=UPI00058D161E|nr:hypothetical protein [Clostridium culturomicium]
MFKKETSLNIINLLKGGLVLITLFAVLSITFNKLMAGERPVYPPSIKVNNKLYFATGDKIYVEPPKSFMEAGRINSMVDSTKMLSEDLQCNYEFGNNALVFVSTEDFTTIYVKYDKTEPEYEVWKTEEEIQREIDEKNQNRNN